MNDLKRELRAGFFIFAAMCGVFLAGAICHGITDLFALGWGSMP